MLVVAALRQRCGCPGPARRHDDDAAAAAAPAGVDDKQHLLLIVDDECSPPLPLLLRDQQHQSQKKILPRPLPLTTTAPHRRNKRWTVVPTPLPRRPRRPTLATSYATPCWRVYAAAAQDSFP